MLTAWMLFLVPTAGPLQVPTPAIDAGEVYVGQPLVRLFAIVNSGTSPLTITDIKTSCGCAAPSLPNKTLSPGQRAELALDVNTLSQPAGPVRWTLNLRYREGETEHSAALELTAKLIREIEIQPAALSLIGAPGFTHEVTVTDRRPKPLAITAIRTDTPGVEATIIRATGVVRVRIAESCPAGTMASTLRITTNDPKYPELRVPITVTRKSAARVTASPTRATLVAGGSALVQLRGDGIRIERIECSHPALTTRWAAGPGQFSTVRIGLDKSKWNGEQFASEVKVILAEPVGEVVVIPVTVRNDD